MKGAFAETDKINSYKQVFKALEGFKD